MNSTLSVTRPRLGWLAGGLAVGLIAAATVGPAVTGAQAQSDQSSTVRTINVTGSGRVKVEPDVADVQLGVTKQAEDAKTASAQAANAMDKVIKALLDLGIAKTDIQTTSLSLNPVYNYQTDTPKIEGWQAVNMVNVTVRDLTGVGGAVDAAIAAGANSVNGISFRVEDPSEAEALARSAAVADAAAKAQQLASAAGVNIVGVLTITESGAQPPQPLYLNEGVRALAAADASAPTPVLPGQVEVSVDVIMQYEIE